MALSNLTKVQTVGIGSNIEVVGVVTTGQFKSGTSNLHSTGVELTNLNVSGIATIGGNLSVGGVLTYEDVTNIDSIGIITARQGIHIDDSIVHIGDTNTKIRFPAADTVTVETAGSEAIRIDSGGRLLIGTATTKSAGSGQYANLNVEGYAGGTECFMSLSRAEAASAMSANDEVANLTFNDSAGYEFARIQVLADAATGATDTPGRIVFRTTADNASSSTERLRITSGGKIGVNYAATPPAETMMIASADSTSALSISHSSGGNRYGFRLSSISGTNQGMILSSFMNSSYSEKLVIDGNGVLVVGHTSSPTSDADKIQAVSTASGTGICLHNYSASNYGNQIAFMKSRNNTIGSNTILQSGDRIGELNFYGNDGSGRSLGAQIQVMADGTQGNDNSPSRINLRTGTNQSMNTRLAVHPAGTVGVSKGGYANSDHSMSFTVNTGTDLTDGLMIVSNYNGGNQNSDTGKLMFCGHGQTNGVYMYKDNEVSYGKGALVFHTHSTSNSYSTQLAETARFTAYGRFGLGTGGPGQTTVDSLMHIQGNSDDGDEACQLTIEDEDTSAGSKIPSIQFKGNGVNTGRIRGTDTGGISFATWNGSSQVQRSIIGNHAEGGAFLLNADDRGWATFRHNNNQGLRTHIRQRYAPGNAVSTYTILRIRRHWWGWGSYKIRCKALYYNSSLESTYFVNGHGSGGNNYSIANETYGGDASSNSWNCTVTHTASNNSPGSSSTWYADVKVNIPNYYYAIIYIEAYSSGYSTDPNNIGADSYCLM